MVCFLFFCGCWFRRMFSDRVFFAVMNCGHSRAILVVGQQSFERNVISIRNGCRLLRLHSQGKVAD
jgi:hypothetical protein